MTMLKYQKYREDWEVGGGVSGGRGGAKGKVTKKLDMPRWCFPPPQKKKKISLRLILRFTFVICLVTQISLLLSQVYENESVSLKVTQEVPV